MYCTVSRTHVDTQGLRNLLVHVRQQIQLPKRLQERSHAWSMVRLNGCPAGRPCGGIRGRRGIVLTPARRESAQACPGINILPSDTVLTSDHSTACTSHRRSQATARATSTSSRAGVDLSSRVQCRCSRTAWREPDRRMSQCSTNR